MEPKLPSISGTKNKKDRPPDNETSLPTGTKEVERKGTKNSRTTKPKEKPPKIKQLKDDVVTLKQYLKLKSKAGVRTIPEETKKTCSTTDAALNSFLEDDNGDKITGDTSAKEREQISADNRDY